MVKNLIRTNVTVVTLAIGFAAAGGSAQTQPAHGGAVVNEAICWSR